MLSKFTFIIFLKFLFDGLVLVIMNVKEQDISIGTVVNSIPSRYDASKTIDTTVRELQKKLDGFKKNSGAQQLRIPELKKVNRTCRNDWVLSKGSPEKIIFCLELSLICAYSERRNNGNTETFQEFFLGITIKYDGVKTCHVLHGDSGFSFPA